MTQHPRPLIRVDRSPDEFSLAEWLGVSDKTARRLVAKGAIESILIKGDDGIGRRHCGLRRVIPESVEAYIARGGAS